MKFIPLFAICAAFSPAFKMFGQDTGGGSGGAGGGEGLTLKQQLDAATKERDDAKASLGSITKERDDAKAALGTATKERDDAKAALGTATKERDDAKAALGTATKERDDAKAEVTKLSGEAKDADTRARELAAASGVPPVPKHEDAAKTTGDGKGHYEAYQKAMDAGEAMKAAKIWGEHQKAIEAHVATLEK